MGESFFMGEGEGLKSIKTRMFFSMRMIEMKKEEAGREGVKCFLRKFSGWYKSNAFFSSSLIQSIIYTTLGSSGITYYSPR